MPPSMPFCSTLTGVVGAGDLLRRIRVLRDTALLSVRASSSRLAFTRSGAEPWPEWGRFLIVDGEPAYELGNQCDTCVSSSSGSMAPTAASRSVRWATGSGQVSPSLTSHSLTQ